MIQAFVDKFWLLKATVDLTFTIFVSLSIRRRSVKIEIWLYFTRASVDVQIKSFILQVIFWWMKILNFIWYPTLSAMPFSNLQVSFHYYWKIIERLLKDLHEYLRILTEKNRDDTYSHNMSQYNPVYKHILHVLVYMFLHSDTDLLHMSILYQMV